MKNWLFIFCVSIVSLDISAQSVGGITSGSTYFCIPINSGFVSLTNFSGTIQHWESSIDNGINWMLISNPTPTQNYSNLSQTTWYRAVVKNGSFPSDTSTISIITIHPAAFGGNITGGGSFCVSAPSGTLNLSNQVGQVSFWEYSVNAGASWTTITNTLSAMPYTPITQNTIYRAIVQNVSVCPKDTSNEISFIISQPTVAGFLQQNDTACYANNFDTLNLSGQTGNVIDWIYSTNLGTSWNSIGSSQSLYTYSNITQTTLYRVLVKNGACLTDTTLPIKIVVVNASMASAGSDKTITRYESVQLNGSGNGIPEWAPNIEINNPNIFNPIVTPTNTTTYILTLTDKHSCFSSDSVTITVIIPFPNAITPNGDGVNDYFLIDNIELYKQSTLSIFNRWGNLVYKASPYNNEWNGKSKSGNDLPDDVYYYTLDYGIGEKPISGNVLIKR